MNFVNSCIFGGNLAVLGALNGTPFAPDLDGVILVADARLSRTDGVMARREAIEARGGTVAGIIVNRADSAGSGRGLSSAA